MSQSLTFLAIMRRICDARKKCTKIDAEVEGTADHIFPPSQEGSLEPIQKL